MKSKHGSDVEIWFADDALQNLVPVMDRSGWRCIWIHSGQSPDSRPPPGDWEQKVEHRFTSLLDCRLP